MKTMLLTAVILLSTPLIAQTNIQSSSKTLCTTICKSRGEGGYGSGYKEEQRKHIKIKSIIASGEDREEAVQHLLAKCGEFLSGFKITDRMIGSAKELLYKQTRPIYIDDVRVISHIDFEIFKSYDPKILDKIDCTEL